MLTPFRGNTSNFETPKKGANLNSKTLNIKR